MEQTPIPPPKLDLATVVGLLRRALFGWAPRGVLTSVLMGLVRRRIGVVMGRLDRMMARFLAGRPVRRGAAGLAALAAGAVEGRVPPVNFWPRRSGWLLGAMGDAMRHHAAWYTQAVDRVLREPEWVALLSAEPGARLLLRPMCRMLGVDLRILDPMAAGAPVADTPKRIRARKPPPPRGSIVLPRGVLTWVRRERRLERARAAAAKPGG